MKTCDQYESADDYIEAVKEESSQSADRVHEAVANDNPGNNELIRRMNLYMQNPAEYRKKYGRKPADGIIHEK